MNEVKRTQLKPTPFLITDVFEVAATFVPAFRWKGSTNLRRVSRSWNTMLSQNGFSPNKTAYAVSQSIDDCQNSQEALFILSDETLYFHCRVEQLFHLASLNPDIALKAMHADIVKENFAYFLHLLAGKNVNLAHHLLDTEALSQKLNGFQLVELAKIDVTIAHKIVTTPKHSSKLIPLHWAGIGSLYDSIAEFILNNPKLMEELHENHIILMIQGHCSLIHLLFKKERFLLTMIERFVMDACISAGVAHHILNLFGHALSAYSLSCLAKASERVANRILRTSVFEKMKQSHFLAKFGSLYPRIAFYILKTPGLCALLSGEDLIEMAKLHAKVAQYIFDSPVLCKTILDMETQEVIFGRRYVRNRKGESLEKIGSKNKGTARKIVMTPALYNQFELLGSDLCHLARMDKEIAGLIFKDPNLRRRFDLNQMTYCIMADNFEVVQYILQNHALTSLPNATLIILGRHNPQIALHILKTDALSSKLNNNELLQLLSYGATRKIFGDTIHLGLVSYVLNKPLLKARLKLEEEGCFSSAVSNNKLITDFHHILELGKALHEIACAVKVQASEVVPIEEMRQLRLAPPR